IRRDERRRRVRVQPREAQEREDGAGEREVQERAERGPGHGAWIDPRRLAGRYARDREEEPCTHHLETRRGQRRPVGERRPPRVVRGERPDERRDDDRARGDRVDAAAAVEEERDAAEAEQEPASDRETHPFASEEAVDDDGPQRDGRDEQRGEARGDALLGPRDGARTDDEQPEPDDRRVEKLARREAERALSAPGPEQDETARERVAQRGEGER